MTRPALAGIASRPLAADRSRTISPELENRPRPADASIGAPETPPASRAARELERWIRRVGPTELPVLIHGETGAGKERVARRLHGCSARRSGPFVAVNCTAVTETLLEAELFGSVRGAYTGSDRDRAGLFRAAHGGTLFLDEVGDTSPAMQAKLLRALELRAVRPVGADVEVEVDARVLAATRRDLRRRVADGLLRVDLFYRLAVVEVRVPPLRDRREDLPGLVRDLAARVEDATGLRPLRLAPDAWTALAAHDWPGNVRELHAALARALLRSNGAPVGATHLGLPERREVADRASLECRMIRAAMDESRGNLSEAARRIGWTRQKLYRRLQALAAPSIHEAPSAAGTRSSDSSTFQ